MNLRHAWLAMTGVALVACNEQTNIGRVDRDAASDAAQVAARDALISKVDTDTAVNGERPDASVAKLPPPGPPNQPYAIPNQDGTFSCANFDGDPYAGCPTRSPGQGANCDLPAGTICDIPDESGVTLCSCVATGLYNEFNCVGIGGRSADCPAQLPQHGSSCDARLRGLACTDYLRPLECTCAADRTDRDKGRRVGCTCDNDTLTWTCRNPSAPAKELYDPAYCHNPAPTLPSGPPLVADKPLASLTADEVMQFCEWVVDTQRAGGSPPPSEPPRVADGYGDGFAFTQCTSPVAFCMPRVPVEICKHLVSRKPCGATVHQVANCLFTGMNDCRVVGDGCLPLAGDANCHETVVQLASAVRPSGVGACAVRLQ